MIKRGYVRIAFAITLVLSLLALAVPVNAQQIEQISVPQNAVCYTKSQNGQVVPYAAVASPVTVAAKPSVEFSGFWVTTNADVPVQVGDQMAAVNCLISQSDIGRVGGVTSESSNTLGGKKNFLTNTTGYTNQFAAITEKPLFWLYAGMAILVSLLALVEAWKAKKTPDRDLHHPLYRRTDRSSRMDHIAPKLYIQVFRQQHHLHPLEQWRHRTVPHCLVPQYARDGTVSLGMRQ